MTTRAAGGVEYSSGSWRKKSQAHHNRLRQPVPAHLGHHGKGQTTTYASTSSTGPPRSPLPGARAKLTVAEHDTLRASPNIRFRGARGEGAGAGALPPPAQPGGAAPFRFRNDLRYRLHRSCSVPLLARRLLDDCPSSFHLLDDGLGAGRPGEGLGVGVVGVEVVVDGVDEMLDTSEHAPADGLVGQFPEPPVLGQPDLDVRVLCRSCRGPDARLSPWASGRR